MSKQLEKSIGLEDLKSYDYQIYQSLKYLAEDKALDFDKQDFKFSVMKDNGQEIELVPKGKDIKVTN